MGVMCTMKSYIKIVCILCCLPVLPAAVVVLLHPEVPSWNPRVLAEGEVDMQIVRSWEEPVLWVDARAPDKYGSGHIQGAVNLYAGEFDQQIGSFLDLWSPGYRVVVYCDSSACGASKEIAKRLRDEFQIEDVYVLKEENMSFEDHE
jgi:rhodanese-related sulfurtransferase